MNIKSDKLKTWTGTLRDLPWGQEEAPNSAAIALSQAEWMGLGKHQAVQAILEVAVSTFLQENPHVLFETWEALTTNTATPMNSRFDGALVGLAA